MKKLILFSIVLFYAVTAFAQAPTITSFSPASGPVGTLVTVTGTNLSSPTSFTIGGVAAISISNTGTQLVGMVMPGAVTGKTAITTAAGSGTSTGNFTVTATPYPIGQQGSKLVGTGSVGNAAQGSTVSVSADGNTAIVTAPYDNSYQGAVWIYTRNGGTWTQQGGKLVGTGAIGAAQQGSSAALSADGNTAIVSGFSDDAGVGAVWIYTRTGGIWTQQGAKLVGTGAVGAAWQGISVAISADGNTAIEGGWRDNDFQGAVWVFTRTAGSWTQQGSKLFTTSFDAWLGVSVSLSADGNTAIAGAVGDNSHQGAVYVFVRSSGIWTHQGTKLVGTGAVGAGGQGNSVSVSADGNTTIVGAGGDNTNQGAAWIFTRTGNTWSQQGSKLIGTGAIGLAPQFGSVSLSADGNTAIIGGNYDNAQAGSLWVYTRNNGIWTQIGSKLTGTGAIGPARQGCSVSISADATTAIIGGFQDNSSAGAAWVFSASSATPAPTIASISPASGPVGTLVTVTGTNLDNPTVFTIGGVAAITISNTGTQLIGMVMPGATTGKAAVSTVNGTVNSTANFTVTATPYPSVQQGTKLVGTDAAGHGAEGYSVSVSADGKTAAVGGYYDNTGAGAVWIYTRNGNTWTQQGTKLVGTGSVSAPTGAQQGYSVAISADGNTVIEGGTGDNLGIGASWIFTRANGTWTQQGAKLVGTGAVTNHLVTPQQGYSVSISADGNTAVVGARGDDLGVGAAWIFSRDNGTWTQQGSKLIGTGAVVTAAQGASVAISADGNTVISGGPVDNGVGATWVFVRNGITWTQQGVKLVGTGAIGPANQGWSSALSADGNTAIIGAPSDNSGHSSAYIFIRSGGIWSQQGGKLIVTGDIGAAAAGSSVSISADGNTAIIGGIIDNSNQGAAWIFTRSGTTWTQRGNKLVGTGVVNYAEQGRSVSVSADGTTAFVGGHFDNGSVGAAWVYSSSTATPPPSTDATLSALTGTGLTLNPTFASATKTYTATVVNTVTSITVTPVTNSTPATIKVNGVAVTSGSPSGAVNLNVGNNTITILVTAQDGTTTQTYTITLIRLTPPSNIATLSGVTVSSGTLSPAFTPATTNYTATVSNATNSITVTPATSNAAATVKINGTAVTSGSASGAIALNVGSNIITTTVTAQDGTTTQTYTLTVTRAAPSASSVASLSSLSISSGTLAPVFAPATTSYAISVGNSTTSVTITPAATDAGATVTVNGTPVTGGSVSGAVALSVGSNTITTVVTAQDGTTTLTYTLTVTRAASSIATLNNLNLIGGRATLSPVFSSSNYSYTVSVDASFEVMALTPTVTDPSATIKINGITVSSGSISPDIPLITGSNVISVVVTAQDGITAHTYTLTVTRAINSTATLSNLAISTGTLSPAFSPTIYNYTASVSNATNSIIVTPTATNPTESINIKGTIIPSGSSTAPIALKVDTNIIAAVVMPQNGLSFLNYYVTITRAAPPATTIASISPATAVTGSTVTITGSNFTGATAVSFGGVPATSFNVVSANTITAIVGTGASGDVSVTTPVNTVNFSGLNFVPVPTITASGPTNIITGGNVILNTTPASGYSYQWLRDGINITGATSSSYKATLAGVYTVSISLNSVSQVSANGVTVNTVFELPANNFQFAITSATCKGSANGSISITATQNLAYTATITGNGVNTPYAFTNSTQINNLAAGTYEVCITVAGQADFQQCFATVIKEPKDLSVYTAVSPSGDQVVVNLDGAAEYKIMLNGILYLTEDSQITLPLAKGVNAITVSTDSPCQGVIVKNINVSPEILVYPNPFTNNINLSLGIDNLKSALISVINVGNGQPVYTNIYNNVTGTLQIDLSGISSGLYLLRISGDNLEKVFKILKK